MKDELYYIFLKYKTGIFVETGTHEGYSVARALDIGYENIISVELDLERFELCVEKFKHDERVHLFYGDSLEKLPLMLENVKTKATFWLDAHMSGVLRNCPTLEEIKIIGQHPIKDHIILIDDMIDFGTPAHENITRYELKKEILKINPNYQFSFESTSKPNNVMVCQVT